MKLRDGKEALKVYGGELWRSRLFSYAYKMSGGGWLPYKHVRFLSDKIEEAVAKKGGRLIIMMPPQTGKSRLTSVWLPTWYLDNNPTKRIILASYSADKAAEWSSTGRDIIQSHPMTLTSLGKSQRADYWTTREGGYLAATSVGGQMTGWSGDLILIDDPVKDWNEAGSPTVRKNHKFWFESVVDTRVQEDSTIILCMTRWHEDDLAGYLLSIDQNWEVVRLPALCESEDDPLGREIGETICVERFSTPYYEAKRDRTPDMVWAGLYQQRPSVEGGTVFKKANFDHRYERLPSGINGWFQSWDFTFGSKTDTASFVVGQVWATTHTKAFLVDQYRRRTDWDGMVEAMRRMTKKYPKAYTKLVENKAAGPLLMQRLDNEIRGMQPVEPGTKSKLERAFLCTAPFKAGDVLLPTRSRCAWIDEYVHEHLLFPNGTNDDQVDATTQFLIEWTGATNSDWW